MEYELHSLRSLLKQKEAEIENIKQLIRMKELEQQTKHYTSSDTGPCTVLDNASIARYSRQLILTELGVSGQLKLKNASVLIVGCGGLGCPAASYLSAAGIGHLGLLDYDEVEISNLHRQILHTEFRVNTPKSASIVAACSQLNSSVKYTPLHVSLDSSNALEIIKDYDIILDCTDNVATRYLLNDACVLSGKPLVSGSALRFEGQLTVYNRAGGPCYRCLFPKPPPAETVTNCSDGGVLGVVPGIIGSLQALEAIKIVTGIGECLSQKLLLFDAMDGKFSTIKLRPKQAGCMMCGDCPSVTRLIDYQQFCGARATDKDASLTLLGPSDRIDVKDYKEMVDKQQRHLLIDVRPQVELEICSLPGAVNIPLDRLQNDKAKEQLENILSSDAGSEKIPVFVVCRRGNDSQIAVKKLQESFHSTTFKDIKGGLTAWAKHVDKNFPVY